MKALLLFFSIVFVMPVYGQINFEEILPPKDFSLSIVRSSPTGERLVQASGKLDAIYTAAEGGNWVEEALPGDYPVEDIRFFDDGTPLLLPRFNGSHLIRRDGAWERISLLGNANEGVRASFIHGDTLFVFQEGQLAYSLDKGGSFNTVFSIPSHLIDNSRNLWKLDDHYVLHHTFGATDSLSVFNTAGQRVLGEELELSILGSAYNSCGELLLMDYDNYYLLKAGEPTLESGAATDFLPDINLADFLSVQSSNGHYFVKGQRKVYRTGFCDYDWELLLDDELVEEHEYFWVDGGGVLYFYNEQQDRYRTYSTVTAEATEQLIPIEQVQLVDVNESSPGHQLALTSNGLFNKQLVQAEWSETFLPEQLRSVDYSPDGTLYVHREDGSLVYSTDNGATFEPPLPLPSSDTLVPEASGIRVLDNGVLLLLDPLLGGSFYSINNGEDWNMVDLPLGIGLGVDKAVIKFVDPYIIVVRENITVTLKRIDTETGEVETADLPTFTDLGNDSRNVAILDDGSVYFWGASPGYPPGYYRYQWGQEPEQVEEVGIGGVAFASGNDLYLYRQGVLSLFDGNEFVEQELLGIPAAGNRDFKRSTNEHLYVIVDDERIFRSTQPLSHEQYITGQVVFDSDENCASDAGEPGLRHWKIQVENEDYFRLRATDASGNFSLSVPQGSYTVKAQAPNGNWSLCEAEQMVEVEEQGEEVSLDFHAQASADCAFLSVDCSTPFLRRCFENYYLVRVRNTGATSSQNTEVRVSLDSFFLFENATIPYSMESGEMVFDLGELAINEEVDFRINFTLSCEAELGQEHCVSSTVSGGNVCGQSPTSASECQPNIGAFDPNDKRVFDSSGRQVETLDKGAYVYYHVRFQNTGTDTAFTVRIEDVLSDKLDLSTLELLNASHDYTYSLKEGRTLELVFDQIMLPDSSTNEPASHGFFKFRIKPLAELDYGASISNQAAIYFDFNEPIFTNDALFVLQKPSATHSPGQWATISVYPNPVGEALFISFPPGASRSGLSVSIVDLLGRPVQPLKPLLKNRVEVSSLTAGAYCLLVWKEGRLLGRSRFVKQ
ncbi:MAG: hypothetical protein GVY26_17600 [Bacteroidetes bacterium]|jgi:hypothetical protein|nr:hypothetical protein [Bacteroidota bacterium]